MYRIKLILNILLFIGISFSPCCQEAAAMIAAPSQASGRGVTLVGRLPSHCVITNVVVCSGRALIAVERQGLWVVDRNGSVVRIEGLPPMTEVNGISEAKGRAFITTVTYDEHNIGTSSSIWTLNDSDRTLQELKDLKWGRCFLQVDGRTLIGTDTQGLWGVTDGQDKAYHIEGPSDLLAIPDLFADSRAALLITYRNVWLLPAGADIASEIPSGAKPYRLVMAISFAHVSDRFLIGTSTSGLWMLQDGSTNPKRIGGVPEDDTVRSILPTPAGTLIGCMSGLYL